MRRRRCACVAHGAACITLDEAIPIVGAGLQLLQMHMHAVAACFIGDHLGFLHAAFQRRIGKHFDLHTQSLCTHRSVFVTKDQARPQHDRISPRTATGDTQCKWVDLPSTPFSGRCGHRREPRSQRQCDGAALQVLVKFATFHFNKNFKYLSAN